MWRRRCNQVIILLLLQLFDKGLSTLKTQCKKDKTDCDENWTAATAALVGYDLPTGNPFASEFIEDPGLRKQIFNATMPDGDDGYRLETGINLREYDMCDEKFKTKLATSVAGYKKIAISTSMAEFGFDIGIEAQEGDYEGTLPSLVKIAWENTNDVRNLATFFTLVKGALAISEAQCITHKIDVSQFLTPSFHPTFVGVLRILADQDTEVKQQRAFKRFVRDYGTHYVSSAFLGAKISSLTRYSSYERLMLGKQKLIECSTMQAFDYFKLEDEQEKKSLNLSQCWSDGDGNHIDEGANSRTRLVNFGTKPNKKLTDWKDIKPIPIKIELTPIVNLFNPTNLDEKHNISSSDILDWFLPLYLKYCKVLKYDCYTNRGCGYDDDCGIEETCVRKGFTNSDYECQVLSWADVPNWPQMPSKYKLGNLVETDDSTSRADTVSEGGLLEPQPANVTWFRAKDMDSSGWLSLNELTYYHQLPNWFNFRYAEAMDRLIKEADLNSDRVIEEAEYLKLHKKHPWYSEQLTFMLINTDNNKFLTKDELLEASKISDDISALNFSSNQLENLVNGLIGIGDKNGDKRITFDEYVNMSHDIFINNFAPRNLRLILRHY